MLKYLEVLLFFSILIAAIYILEFILLIIKNILSRENIFNLPIGFI